MTLQSPGCKKDTAFYCDIELSEECIDVSQTCNGVSECLNGRDESIQVCGEYSSLQGVNINNNRCFILSMNMRLTKMRSRKYVTALLTFSVNQS